MRFRCQHIFHTDIDTYWSQIFFDHEYNRRLYLDALGFRRWEMLEFEELPNGVRRRKLFLEPQGSAPAFIHKLVGDSIGYYEEGTFDPHRRIWSYRITLNKLADKARIAGEFWVEPRGPKQVERICDVDVNIDIFGVGGMVERFIESQTRANYEKATEFTNAWIRERGLG